MGRTEQGVDKIAIYDMDCTITVRGTYAAFLTHMALSIAPWRLIFLPVAGIVMIGYVLRLVTRARAKELNQALLIGRRVSRARIMPAVQSYADKVIAKNIRAGALAQIAQDRADGFRLVIASASYRLYVEPIAMRLGFDDVVATNHFTQGVDYIRSKIAGENCYDVAKMRMIETWMETHEIDSKNVYVRAYSDHVSDAPLLEFANEPHAANPHRALEQLAGAKGWPVLRW